MSVSVDEVVSQLERELGPSWRYRAVNIEYWTYRSAFDAVVKHGGRPDGKAVLDVGWGIGTVLLLLDAISYQAHGVEISDPFDALKTGLVERGIAVKWGVDVERDPLPFENHSFDVVTSTGVLEHFHHSPEPILSAMRRVLRDDGLVAHPHF